MFLDEWKKYRNIRVNQMTSQGRTLREISVTFAIDEELVRRIQNGEFNWQNTKVYVPGIS